MKHALVVGGTGMLAQAARYLAEKQYCVSVVARDPVKMKRLIDESSCPERFNPVVADYNDTELLQSAISSAIHENGPLSLVVAWIHSYAKDALPAIVQSASASGTQWRLIHVLGSSRNPDKAGRHLALPAACHYAQVRLGFIIEDENSRWLTDQEISAGVIKAIEEEKQQTVVGTLEPWERRP